MAENELRACRIAHGLTQVELAQKVGVSYRTIKRWEKGRIVRAARVKGIINFLNNEDPKTKNVRPILKNDLKKFRESQGLSQQDIAVKLGVSLPTIKRWEGGGSPRPRHRHRLAALLNNVAEPTDQDNKAIAATLAAAVVRTAYATEWYNNAADPPSLRQIEEWAVCAYRDILHRLDSGVWAPVGENPEE